MHKLRVLSLRISASETTRTDSPSHSGCRVSSREATRAIRIVHYNRSIKKKKQTLFK